MIFNSSTCEFAVNYKVLAILSSYWMTGSGTLDGLFESARRLCLKSILEGCLVRNAKIGPHCFFVVV